MWRGDIHQKGMFIDQGQKCTKETEAILIRLNQQKRRSVHRRLSFPVPDDQKSLSVSYNAKYDYGVEPASSIGEKRLNHLFTIIQWAKERGFAVFVLYLIKMEEIFPVSRSEVTILARDGQWILAEPLAGTDDGLNHRRMMVEAFSPTRHFPDERKQSQAKRNCITWRHAPANRFTIYCCLRQGESHSVLPPGLVERGGETYQYYWTDYLVWEISPLRCSKRSITIMPAKKP